MQKKWWMMGVDSTAISVEDLMEKGLGSMISTQLACIDRSLAADSINGSMLVRF